MTQATISLFEQEMTLEEAILIAKNASKKFIETDYSVLCSSDYQEEDEEDGYNPREHDYAFLDDIYEIPQSLDNKDYKLALWQILNLLAKYDELIENRNQEYVEQRALLEKAKEVIREISENPQN